MLLLGFNGLGLLLYAVFWAVLPQQLPTGEQRTRRDLALLLPFGAIGLGVVLLQGLLFDDNGVARHGGLAGRRHGGRRRRDLAPVRSDPPGLGGQPAGALVRRGGSGE
nr:hypothetical protein GCM10020092_098440 [Actinoplanes digitatis]